MRFITKIFIATIVLVLYFASPSMAQNLRYSYKAERVLMDKSHDEPAEPVVKAIIARYKPEMDRKMQEVIGVSEVEMRSSRPESLLSNFAADALVEFAAKRSGSKVDFGLTNFGGIRAALPGGSIRLYDVYSIFPFENYVVILDLPGKSVKALFESFARNRVEALSGNVKLIIDEDDREIEELLINGEKLDMSKIYRIATIDFLLSGGDNVVALKDAVKVEETGLLIRDAIIEKIASFSASGAKVTARIDGRVQYED